MSLVLIEGASRRRGVASLVALITVVAVAGVCVALLSFQFSSREEQRFASERAEALYIADAGVSTAVAALQSGVPPVLGSEETPISFGGGGFWGDISDHGDGTYTIVSNGTSGRGRLAIEAIVESQTEDASSWAVFAGNAAGDPRYTLDLGGTLLSADTVNGNVYSGGNVHRFGGAAISGDIQAGGVIAGAEGLEGRPLPAPNFEAMDYESNHDYDVAALFAGATFATGSGGGMAWQVPAGNPAHILRKNPTDRALYTALTVKTDYFLEDPYEPYGLAQILGAPFDISIPGAANGRVYFIDGNLWSLNLLMILPTTRYRIRGGGAEGTRVTFVVKGNIYFSDNFSYSDSTRDGVAFVAVADPTVADSGNIYIGGLVPQLGTCSSIGGFLYAERDIEENNLVSTGVGWLLGPITIYGAMVARQQIRVYDQLLVLHSQLTVNHDARLFEGTLDLPGIPGRRASGTDFDVVSWRIVSSP